LRITEQLRHRRLTSDATTGRYTTLFRAFKITIEDPNFGWAVGPLIKIQATKWKCNQTDKIETNPE
jgi:hypothetical protein